MAALAASAETAATEKMYVGQNQSQSDLNLLGIKWLEEGLVAKIS